MVFYYFYNNSQKIFTTLKLMLQKHGFKSFLSSEHLAILDFRQCGTRKIIRQQNVFHFQNFRCFTCLVKAGIVMKKIDETYHFILFQKRPMRSIQYQSIYRKILKSKLLFASSSYNSIQVLSHVPMYTVYTRSRWNEQINNQTRSLVYGIFILL